MAQYMYVHTYVHTHHVWIRFRHLFLENKTIQVRHTIADSRQSLLYSNIHTPTYQVSGPLYKVVCDLVDPGLLGWRDHLLAG